MYQRVPYCRLSPGGLLSPLDSFLPDDVLVFLGDNFLVFIGYLHVLPGNGLLLHFWDVGEVILAERSNGTNGG